MGVGLLAFAVCALDTAVSYLAWLKNTHSSPITFTEVQSCSRLSRCCKPIVQIVVSSNCVTYFSRILMWLCDAQCQTKITVSTMTMRFVVAADLDSDGVCALCVLPAAVLSDWR